MIISVLTSLRINQLEKKLKKKYGLSEAEAKEIVRQGRVEVASRSRKGTRDSMEHLKEFCEARLQQRSKAEACVSHHPVDAKNEEQQDFVFVEYPAIEACCSGTVAWSKSDTETNSAWESKDSPAKSTHDSMTPPAQIYPLHKYMHQEDPYTDEFTKTNEVDRSSPSDSRQFPTGQLPPVPEMDLSIRLGEIMQANVTEIAELSPVGRQLDYGNEEIDEVQWNESPQHAKKMGKIETHSNEIDTPMDFLTAPSKQDIPPGPPSLLCTKRDPGSVSSSSSSKQSLSYMPRTLISASTPLSTPVDDSSESKGEALQHNEEEVSVITREEQSEDAVEIFAHESSKINPKVKRRVNHPYVPRVIFVQDPPEIEVLPFTDDEGFAIKREKRLSPIERLSL